jgi:hypothetical protein
MHTYTVQNTENSPLVVSVKNDDENDFCSVRK